MENQDTEFYTFRYEDPEGRVISHSVPIYEGAPWTRALGEFLVFLSSVYGYDLQSRVDMKGLDWFEQAGFDAVFGKEEQ